jgi:mono/diheme cytochrome c family protein
MTRQRGWIFLVIVMAPASFCSSAMLAHARKLEVRPAAESRSVRSSSRLVQDTLSSQEEAVAAGKKLYKANCAHCHGLEGRGQDRAVDLRSALVRNAPPGTLFSLLRNGRIRRGMPSWSRLPDQQLWQIIAYLKSLP